MNITFEINMFKPTLVFTVYYAHAMGLEASLIDPTAKLISNIFANNTSFLDLKNYFNFLPDF